MTKFLNYIAMFSAPCLFISLGILTILSLTLLCLQGKKTLVFIYLGLVLIFWLIAFLDATVFSRGQIAGGLGGFLIAIFGSLIVTFSIILIATIFSLSQIQLIFTQNINLISVLKISQLLFLVIFILSHYSPAIRMRKIEAAIEKTDIMTIHKEISFIEKKKDRFNQALKFAVRKGNDKVLNFLLQRSQKFKPDFTELLKEVDTSHRLHIYIAQILIENKAQITPEILKLTTERGGIELLKFFSENIDLKKLNNDVKVELMKSAIAKDKIETLAFFVKNIGFNINLKDQNNRTALIKLFYDKIRIRGANPLKEVFKYGADPDIQDKNGKAALMYAVEKEIKFGFIEEILKNSKKINLKDNEGNNVLHLCSDKSFFHKNKSYIYRDKGFERLAKLFLDKDLDINSQNNQGKTPLLIACEDGAYPQIMILIENGADVKISDNENNTILHLAILNITDDFDYVLNAFVSKGLDINSQNKDGNTGLHILAGNKEISNQHLKIEMLLETGANPDIKNNQGKSARDLDFALIKSCEEAIKN